MRANAGVTLSNCQFSLLFSLVCLWINLNSHWSYTCCTLTYSFLSFFLSFFSEMRGEGPSGNNLKSINSSHLKCPGFKRVVWVFYMAVMELLSMLRDLAADSLWKRAGLEDDNLLKCSVSFALLCLGEAKYIYNWNKWNRVCMSNVYILNRISFLMHMQALFTYTVYTVHKFRQKILLWYTVLMFQFQHTSKWGDGVFCILT